MQPNIQRLLYLLELDPISSNARQGLRSRACSVSGKEVETGYEMVQKDSVNTSRPSASFTTMQISGSSCSPACFNSLITRAANLRASSSSCSAVPSVLPYALTLSRRVTTKWYRGKCAPLSASENGGSKFYPLTNGCVIFASTFLNPPFLS